MSTTYAELVNEVLLSLSGYTMRQESMTHLTQPLTADGLTLNLGNLGNIGKGVIEIDDELIYIDSFDRVSNTATIAPYGRGYMGTTAVEHAINSKVIVSPTFPRTMVKKAINEALLAVYPNLFSLGTHEFTYNSVKNTYEIPAEVQTIQYVSWSTIGPTKEWRPVKGWRQDSMAAMNTWATGNTITIYDRLPAGRKIQFHYTTVPSAFNGAPDDADYETTTGLTLATKDVIIYGACYRLASFIDAGRLNYSSAEADNADTKIQYGSGASTSRFFLALYNQRLKEEADKLRDLYPSRAHYTRY